jgi:hypothetical protein
VAGSHAVTGSNRLLNSAHAACCNHGHQPVPDVLPVQELDRRRLDHLVGDGDGRGEPVNLEKSKSPSIIHRALS